MCTIIDRFHGDFNERSFFCWGLIPCLKWIIISNRHSSKTSQELLTLFIITWKNEQSDIRFQLRLFFSLSDQDADNPVEKQSQVAETNTEMITSRSPSSIGETSPSFSNCSSPISPSTNDHLDQPQTEPKSPKIINNVEIKQEIVLPKLRLNVMLASDPALQPEAKDLKVIRMGESNVDNKNNHNTDRDSDDVRRTNDSHQHPRMVEDKVENYLAPINEPIINVDAIPRVPGK